MKKGLIIIFSMLAIACGGGGSGSGPENASFSGKVFTSSGYTITNVCFDSNNNKVCDNGESSAKIDGTLNADGTFTINGTTDDTDKNLIAEITANTRAAASKLVLEAVNGKVVNDEYVISSVTTMIKSRMDLECESLADAEEKVRSDLGISLVDDLYSNNVTAKADKIFKTIVDLLNKINLEFSNGLMVAIYHEIATQLNKIDAGTEQDIVDNTSIDQDVVNESEHFFLTQGLYLLDYNDNPNTNSGDPLIYVTEMKLTNGKLIQRDIRLDERDRSDNTHQYNSTLDIDNIQPADIFKEEEGAATFEPDGYLSASLKDPSDSSAEGDPVEIKVINSKDAESRRIKGMVISTNASPSEFSQLNITVNFSGKAREYIVMQKGDRAVLTYNAEGMKQIIAAYLAN